VIWSDNLEFFSSSITRPVLILDHAIFGLLLLHIETLYLETLLKLAGGGKLQWQLCQ